MDTLKAILDDVRKLRSGRESLTLLLHERERYVKNLKADIKALKRSGNSLEAPTIKRYQEWIEEGESVIKTLKTLLELY